MEARRWSHCHPETPCYYQSFTHSHEKITYYPSHTILLVTMLRLQTKKRGSRKEVASDRKVVVKLSSVVNDLLATKMV